MALLQARQDVRLQELEVLILTEETRLISGQRVDHDHQLAAISSVLDILQVAVEIVQMKKPQPL